MTTHILGDNVPRKSNFDPDLARKITKYYEEHPEELNDRPKEKTEVPLAPADNSIKQPIGEYILMPEAKTYALGVHALQEACIKENNQNHPKFTLPNGKIVYRPLTFKENCLARLHQFNTLTNPNGSQRTLEQRMEFLFEANDSCCGIIRPAKNRYSSKFKLILQSPELISLAKDFAQEFTYVDYSSLTSNRELDRKIGKYNNSLTLAEISSHEGWLALFEDDRIALQDYHRAVGEALGLWKTPVSKFMDFSLPDNYLDLGLKRYRNDQLETVCVSHIIDNQQSEAYDRSLNHSSRFLRRKP